MLSNKKKLFIILLMLIIILFIYYQIFIPTTIVPDVNTTMFSESYISEADKIISEEVPDHYDFNH